MTPTSEDIARHDPTEFCRLGEAICGKRWQRALAQRIKVDERTVRRWKAGECVVPGPVMMLLRLMAEQR